MPTISQSNRFKRCLESLRHGGGDAAVAARRAERLLEELSRESASSLEFRWKTHNGEARIEGCRKFYLGRRFRLVCIRKEQHILFACAGPHDECDRWIEQNRHRDFSSLMAEPALNREPLPEPGTALCPGDDPSQPGPETDYEAYLRERISDRELGSVLGALFTLKEPPLSQPAKQ